MKTYTLKEFSKITNIPQKTLLAWDKSGKLSALQDENGSKVYTERHLSSCTSTGIDKTHTRIKTYKVEVDLKEAQEKTFRQSLGTLRFVYNLFIEKNIDNHKNKLSYQNNFSFSIWLNNEYLPNNPNKKWIKETSSKAIKDVIGNAHKAYSQYLTNLKEFLQKLKSGKKVKRDKFGKPIWPKPPKFKKKFVDEPSFYFIKDGVKIERHRVKIPILGWIHLKEKGYIPRDSEVISGTLKLQADRIYLSLRIREEVKPTNFIPSQDGIGIDLGVKETAITSTQIKFPNINKTREVKRLEKLSKRLDRKISRQKDAWKERIEEWEQTHIGEKPTRNRLNRSYAKRQRIKARLTHIRDDYNNKIVAELVRVKPVYITIEDLNISDMMKNRHLSKAIADQKLYSLRMKLIQKCKEAGIEVRLVSQWFPSSKTCHNCGCINHDLKLKDRVFICPDCGYKEDRDINAAMNLRDASSYTKVA